MENLTSRCRSLSKRKTFGQKKIALKSFQPIAIRAWYKSWLLLQYDKEKDVAENQDFIKLEDPCKAGKRSNGNPQFEAMRALLNSYLGLKFWRALHVHKLLATSPSTSSRAWPSADCFRRPWYIQCIGVGAGPAVPVLARPLFRQFN